MLYCNNRLNNKVNQLNGLTDYFFYLSRLSNSATISMFDSTVLLEVQRRGIDYGYQRSYGTLAALLSAPAGGALIDHFATGDKDYRYTQADIIFSWGTNLKKNRVQGDAKKYYHASLLITHLC